MSKNRTSNINEQLSVGSDPKSDSIHSKNEIEIDGDCIESHSYDNSIAASFSHVKSNHDIDSSFKLDIGKDASGRTKRSQMLLNRIQTLLKSGHSPFKEQDHSPLKEHR